MESPFVNAEERPSTASDTNIPRPLAVVYPTRTDGAPHIVSVLDVGEFGALSCTCKAMRSIHIRPQGCWAMKDVRRMLGLPTPAVVVESEVRADTGPANSPLPGDEEVAGGG